MNVIKRTRGTKGMTITGPAFHDFVLVCKSLDEARRSLPNLTEEQFAAIRAGKATFQGDTKEGLYYVEPAE